MPDHEMDEHIGCVLPRSERIALDAWAQRNDLSRSQAIRRAIRRLLAEANARSRYQTRDDTVRRDAGEARLSAGPYGISGLSMTQ